MGVRVHRRWASTLATAATTALAAFTLVSCSPPERELIGIRPTADSGGLASLRPCGEDRVASVEVLGSVIRDNLDGPVEDLTSWRVRSPRSVQGPEEIKLFETPDSWTGDPAPLGDQRLKATHGYSVDFIVASGDGVSYRGVVSFTAADLARLERGQVWAGGRAMTVEEFQKHTDQECDDGWF
ncbi:hypothetical protein ABZ446_44505 [Streptomyces sp. NPDC005813]|uniref:hypothetical protein n=1 Tax=Streptomyces sp. NPDC005813 TaxID=3155592 RepID=UPI00340BFA77